MHVLIAEDQPDIACLMAKLVARAGHEPAIAGDGFEAVSLATQRAPDLVLLDINMPGIDGYETARRLRQQFGQRFPIFAVTATIVDPGLAEQSGFTGVFSKPFHRETLIALMNEFS